MKCLIVFSPPNHEKAEGKRKKLPMMTSSPKDSDVSSAQPSLSSSVPSFRRKLVHGEVGEACDEALDESANDQQRRNSAESRCDEDLEDCHAVPPELPTVDASASVVGADVTLHIGASSSSGVRISVDQGMGEPQMRESIPGASPSHAPLSAGGTSPVKQTPHRLPSVVISPFATMNNESNFGGSILKKPHLGASHAAAGAVSPPSGASHRLAPLEHNQKLQDDSDEGLKRRLEAMMSELSAKLLVPTTSRSPQRRAAHGESLTPLPTHRKVSPLRNLTSSSDRSLTTTMCDTRRMRDGLIAMTTEAKQEDFRTIVYRKEIQLAHALDEKAASAKKLANITNKVQKLQAEQEELDTMRRNHSVEVQKIRLEIGRVVQETNELKWQETHLHNELSNLTQSLQYFRRKRSSQEQKLFQELNAVSFELQSLNKGIEEDESRYQKEWHELRAEMRKIQEEIVSFKPQEWLAATIASGKEKKVLKEEFAGDTRKADQFMSVALAAAQRRKTVGNLEDARGGLDAFLATPVLEEKAPRRRKSMRRASSIRFTTTPTVEVEAPSSEKQ